MVLSLLLVPSIASAQTQYLPGEVVYDFTDPNDPNFLACWPDDWNFFGISQTDFGRDPAAEDGSGAFQSADWDLCDITYGFGTIGCQWAGAAIGVGPFPPRPGCDAGGVSDANLDLSLGTGLSIRVKVDLTAGFGGTLGAGVQLQLVDFDGTTAVVPRNILMNPSVTRVRPLAEEWQTINFLFDGLDWAWDNDDAVAGAVPGLNLSRITQVKLIWRRGAATGVNVFQFDTITLTDDPVELWADDDSDGDVDVANLAFLQRSFGGALSPSTERLDADFDGDIDTNDSDVFLDCLQGPDVTTDFFAWCY
jgi:hypothetical protein